MDSLKITSVCELPRVSDFMNTVEINQEYLHIPEQDLTLENKEFSFKLSLIEENNDLLLKSVTLIDGEWVSEKLLTYEDTQERLKSYIPGMENSDVGVYPVFANVIFHYRERYFAKNILLEHGIAYEQILAYRGFALYPTFNLKSLPKPFPVFKFNNNCQWQLNLYYKMMKTSRYETPQVVPLVKVSWNDEKGIRQLVKMLLDESRYRELEIQAVLSL